MMAQIMTLLPKKRQANMTVHDIDDINKKRDVPKYTPWARSLSASFACLYANSSV